MATLSDSSAGGNPQLSLAEKIERFGDEAIPIILPWGSKGERVEGSPFNHYRDNFQKRSHADTLTPEYQADLYNEHFKHNTAMRQGGGMTRVVGWDIDTDDETLIGEFIQANPIVLKTFTTRGARGFTAWFIMEGEIPKPAKIILRKNVKPLKDDAVEWRSSGYSVIDGLHPDTGELYRVLRDLPPVRGPWSIFTCPGPAYAKKWPRLFDEKEKRLSGANPNLTPLSDWQLKRRTAYVDKNYEVTDWKLEQGKAQIICKNRDAHNSDTGQTDTVIYIGGDEIGLVSYACSHTSCQDFNKEETKRLMEGFLLAETFPLHSQNTRRADMMRDLYGHLTTNGGFYRTSPEPPYGLIRWRENMAAPVRLAPETLTDQLGEENILFSKIKYRKLTETLASTEEKIEILSSPAGCKLPYVKQIVKYPLLVAAEEPGGEAQIIAQKYSTRIQTIVLGKEDGLEEKKFEDALGLLNTLLDFWLWVEPIDRARAWAELLTPALLRGGFCRKPIPAMLVTANEYNAGKTLWHKTVSYCYRHEADPHAFTQTQIGGIEDLLKVALINNDPFFFIDELSGTIKNPFLNAFITGGVVMTVRTVFARAQSVTDEGLMIQLAGVKGFVMDQQLSSRALPIRILKPPAGTRYHYSLGSSGELLLDWVRENWKEILSSIYSIIKKWTILGCPGTQPDSRFPSWSIPINGILENVLNLPGATRGLEEIQEEYANPATEWLPDFINVLLEEDLLWVGNNKTPVALSCSRLAELAYNQGIGIPGTKPDLRDNPAIIDRVRAMGNVLQRLIRTGDFNGSEPVYRLGSYFLIRFERSRKKGKPQYNYLFSTERQCTVRPSWEISDNSVSDFEIR